MKEKYQLKKFINQLNTIKISEIYDKAEKYDKIYNICLSMDSENPNFNFCRYVEENDYVKDDEEMDYLIKQNSDSLDRLRCFIGNTWSDDLYRIDGYGNLDNVTSEDLDILCDYLIEHANENLKELDAEL